MDALTQAIFLSVVANRLVEAFVAPVKQRYPSLDLWWLIYVSWVVGGALGWLSGINLFADTGSLPGNVGVLLTAVAVGGGSNLIADIFKRSA